MGDISTKPLVGCRNLQLMDLEPSNICSGEGIMIPGMIKLESVYVYGHDHVDVDGFGNPAQVFWGRPG
jgi:hypothetical protein